MATWGIHHTSLVVSDADKALRFYRDGLGLELVGDVEEQTERLAQQVEVVKIFAGKAAPAYTMAKEIIHLIVKTGELINNDATIQNKLKVVFVPNYNVSVAELIIPASDVSEHISTVGKEASGTR